MSQYLEGLVSKAVKGKIPFVSSSHSSANAPGKDSSAPILSKDTSGSSASIPSSQTSANTAASLDSLPALHEEHAALSAHLETMKLAWTQFNAHSSKAASEAKKLAEAALCAARLAHGDATATKQLVSMVDKWSQFQALHEEWIIPNLISSFDDAIGCAIDAHDEIIAIAKTKEEERNMIAHEIQEINKKLKSPKIAATEVQKLEAEAQAKAAEFEYRSHEELAYMGIVAKRKNALVGRHVLTSISYLTHYYGEVYHQISAVYEKEAKPRIKDVGFNEKDLFIFDDMVKTGNHAILGSFSIDKMLKPPVLKAVNPSASPITATQSPAIPSKRAETSSPITVQNTTASTTPAVVPSVPSYEKEPTTQSTPQQKPMNTTSSAPERKPVQAALIPDLLDSFDSPAPSKTADTVPIENLLGDDFSSPALPQQKSGADLLDLDFSPSAPVVAKKAQPVAYDPLEALAQMSSPSVPLAAKGMQANPAGFDVWDSAFSSPTKQTQQKVSLDDFAQQAPQKQTKSFTPSNSQFDDLLSFGVSPSKGAAKSTPKTERKPAAQSSNDDGANGGEFDREKLREQKQQEVQDRIEKARQDHLEQERRAAEELELYSQLDNEIKGRVESWAANKQNLRALLASLHEILWTDSGWKEMKMSELVSAAQVKKGYHKALIIAHPDKVRNGTHEQQVLVKLVFDKLKIAYEKLREEL